MSIIKVMEKFKSQEDCIEFLEYLRFNDNPYCPLCNSHNVSRKNPQDATERWRCRSCRSSFNVLSGTIFSGTRTPLRIWFLAIVLMTYQKKGISSYALAELLDISQDNAWRIQDKIRQEMYDEVNETLVQAITGIAEMDETYVSIKTEYQHSSWTDKMAILGVTSRTGKVAMRRTYSTNSEAMQWFVSRYLDLNNVTLYTDQYRGYAKMKEIVEHAFVKRRHGKFIDDIHTNGMESLWTVVKRTFRGTYYHCSEERINNFLAEISFRLNWKHLKREQILKQFLKFCLFKHRDIAYHVINDSWML